MPGRRGIADLAIAIVLATATATAAAPAPASAASNVTVHSVTSPGYAPQVRLTATAASPCTEDGCRWFAVLRTASDGTTCADSPETPWVGPVESTQAERTYDVAYPTSTGPRSERVCLFAYDTKSEGYRLLAEAPYEVPPPGGTWTPATSSPPAGGGESPPPSSPGGPGSAGPPPAEQQAASAPGAPPGRRLSEREARQVFSARLTRRYGRLWTRARRRSIACRHTHALSLRCRARWTYRGRRYEARGPVFVAIRRVTARPELVRRGR